MKRQLLFIAFLANVLISFSQNLTPEEMKLYNLIMDYRKTKGLPKIPISSSLTFVAQTHVKDLTDNQPVKGRCNLHSWSSKGKWNSCCYTDNHAKAKCMWEKPRELTSYQGDGFEIAASGMDNAKEALDGWKTSKLHNAVIVNSGMWKEQWQAIGIGMYGGYAVVWFGHEVDSTKPKP